MAPSTLTDAQLADLPCECSPEVDADLRARFPEHSQRDHALYELGANMGWKLARDELLKQEHHLDGVTRRKVQEILG